MSDRRVRLGEIDVLVRRTTTYAMVVVVIAGLYLAVLSGLGRIVPAAFSHYPMVLAILNVALLFLIAPLQARTQDAVDRVFFRKRYDSDRALSELGQRLVSAYTRDGVFECTHDVLRKTVCPASTALFQWSRNALLDPICATGVDPSRTQLHEPLVSRIARGDLLARYEWDDGSGRAVPAAFGELRADLLLPIMIDGAPLAVLALGPKNSGRSYNVTDVTFLRAASSQIALAMKHATVFAELEAWNVRLEAQVQDRTAALKAANDELCASVEQLRDAYRQLEAGQERLMRSDRLATLGRLTAGIAHEVNTPLGATMNALSIIRTLVREYAESVDDLRVNSEDHHQIARELAAETEAAAVWARKAATFINRVRVHGREPGAAVATSFALGSVVAETRELLTHRLRGSVCRLDFEEETETTLVGDPGRLGQVLINLVANAIDAYEDRAIVDGRIVIRCQRGDGLYRVTVRDWAGGIPAELVPRIFDEMFTTKEPGRGTGIGLCIARSLVEQVFGGTLAVEVDPGVGSCFTITVPARAPASARATIWQPSISSQDAP